MRTKYVRNVSAGNRTFYKLFYTNLLLVLDMFPILAEIRGLLQVRLIQLALANQQREKIIYQQSSRGSGKTPLFGAGAAEFGLDWAYTRPRKVAQQALPNPNAPKPTWNRGSSVVSLRPLRTYGKSQIQETRRRLSFEQTDQRPTPRSRGMINWDGKPRHFGTRPSYLSSPRKASRRKPEPSIRRDPYSFY